MGERRRILVWEWETGLPLGREETDSAHKKIAVYKGKGGNPRVRMRWLILTGYVN